MFRGLAEGLALEDPLVYIPPWSEINQLVLSRLVAALVWLPLKPVYVVFMTKVPAESSVPTALGFRVLVFEVVFVVFTPLKVRSVRSLVRLR